MLHKSRILCLLSALLLAAAIAHAGGTAPGEETPQEPARQDKVTATPAQTSAAISKARRAVTPPAPRQTTPARAVAPRVMAAPFATSQAKAVTATDQNSWMLGSSDGKCAPLSSASSKTGNIGTFSTPQEFARKMQQRGHQAFTLDIGDVRDQVVRIKVPDMNLDLTFIRAGICR